MASKRTSRKSNSKIPPKTAKRIVTISLQHPELGARRLVPLLTKKRISVSAASIQNILRRHGLQSREKRLAKAAETIAEPVIIPKRFPEKIPAEVEDRIIELSLQNPDYGVRRLGPLLQQEEIFVSASAVYRILKRNNLENRQKRLLKIKEQRVPEALPAAETESPEPRLGQIGLEPTPAVDEVLEAVFKPGGIIPIAPEDKKPVPAEMPEPVPESAVVATAKPEQPPLRKAPIKTIKKRGHWIFYPLYLLLLVLIGYLGFHTFKVIQTARVETETGRTAEFVADGMDAKTESSASVRLLDGYSKIWERDLFNTAKVEEPDSEKKISLDKLALAKKDLGLELVGTVVADDPKMSLAIIDNRSIRKQEAYREGDKAGKVEIKKILRNNVVITTAEGDELLTVEIKESGRSASGTPSRYIGSQATSAQEPPETRRRMVSTSSISLKRDEVAASLADVGTLMEQIRLTAYMQDDQPAGFRLGFIPRNSVLRKMGLRSRDVIVGVDDESIASPDEAPDFFQKLADGGEVTIKLKRRRRMRQIKLRIE
jgi:general secretion pathway protein C